MQNTTVVADRKPDADSGLHANTHSGLQQEPSVEVPPNVKHPQLQVKSKPSEERKSRASEEGNRQPNGEVKLKATLVRCIIPKTSEGGYVDETTDVDVKGCATPPRQHLAEIRQHCEDGADGYQHSVQAS